MIGHQQELRRAGRSVVGQGRRGVNAIPFGTLVERCVAVATVLLIGALLFVPLLVVGIIGSSTPAAAKDANVEAAVGIAVILRAAAHRTVTAALGGVVHATFATAVRAGSRAVLQRLIRTTVLTVVGALAVATPASLRPRLRNSRRRLEVNAFAVGAGALVMGVSCVGVLLGLGPGLGGVVHESEVPHIIVAGALAATPLLVYAAAHTVSSRYWSVQVDYTTSIDGLLLQAYFTGAGSFLPMATDIECAGKEEDCMRVAAVGIGSLYLLHLALVGLGAATGSTVMEFASSMALLYAFVFIFPVRPLPGSRIWRHKRRVWVALVIPILASFYFLAPAGLTVIV